MKAYFLTTCCLLIIVSLFYYSVCADTVYLKNSKKVEGKVIEKTDEYIKIDFMGTPLTYWMNEIEKIKLEGDRTSFMEEKKEIKLPSQEENAESYFKRGTDYLKEEGRWQQAIDELKKSHSVDPYHVGAHFNLGCAYALTGQYHQAIEEFNKTLSLEIVPFNAFCYFNIAGIYVKQALLTKNSNLFMKASENFHKAVELLPNFILAIDYAMHSQTNANIDLNNIDIIRYTLDEIGIPPDSVIFLPENKIMGTGEKRICIFDAQSPPLLYFFRSPNCYWRVCESKLDLQRPENLSEEAKECLESVLNLLKAEPDNRLNKLIKRNIFGSFVGFYLHKQDWDKIIEFSEKVKNLGFNYSSEYILLALAYFKKGDYLRAKESAKKALEIDPETPQRGFLEEVIRSPENNL